MLRPPKLLLTAPPQGTCSLASRCACGALSCVLCRICHTELWSHVCITCTHIECTRFSVTHNSLPNIMPSGSSKWSWMNKNRILNLRLLCREAGDLESWSKLDTVFSSSVMFLTVLLDTGFTLHITTQLLAEHYRDCNQAQFSLTSHLQNEYTRLQTNSSCFSELNVSVNIMRDE